MSLNEQGIAGEKMAREWLLDKYRYNLKNLTQIDWLIKDINGDWFCVEVKNKKRFKGSKYYSDKPKYNTFEGHGLDLRQFNYRMDLWSDKDIPCLFLIFEPDTKYIYYQWLSVLKDKDNHLITKNNIIIFDIKDFNCETRK